MPSSSPRGQDTVSTRCSVSAENSREGQLMMTRTDGHPGAGASAGDGDADGAGAGAGAG